jgi:hypothetical protein
MTHTPIHRAMGTVQQTHITYTVDRRHWSQARSDVRAQIAQLVQYNRWMTQNSARLDQLSRISEQLGVSRLGMDPSSTQLAARGWEREPAPFYDLNATVANWVERQCGTVYDVRCSSKAYAVSLAVDSSSWRVSQSLLFALQDLQNRLDGGRKRRRSIRSRTITWRLNDAISHFSP